MSIKLVIQSRLDQVRLVRAAICGILEHLLVSENDIHALVLAVTEITNNSIEHGYRGAEDRVITVDLTIRGTDVQVSVIDDAPEFPEDQRYRLAARDGTPDDPDEGWPVRGHGLQIVQEIVDSIALSYEAGRNILTLNKRISLRS